ncbi:MAG: hypothetical protein ACK48H_06630 [Microcystis sp.]
MTFNCQESGDRREVLCILPTPHTLHPTPYTPLPLHPTPNPLFYFFPCL